MVRIYRRSDKIPLKIDDLTIEISPLTTDQKTEIEMLLQQSRREANFKKATQAVILAMKYAVRGIKGVTDSEGKPYQLTFDEQGNLTQESIDDLNNLKATEKLGMVCVEFLKGIPDSFTDSEGNKIDGVEFIKSVPNEESDSKNASM